MKKFDMRDSEIQQASWVENSPVSVSCPDCRKPKPGRHPDYRLECILNKPLWMVIPTEGTHLSCPVHPNGHHVYGNRIWC